jgi:citrate synthase
VHELLTDAAVSGDAEHAVARVLASGGVGRDPRPPGGAGTDRPLVPGFGHLVYRGPDPRADALLDLLDPLLTRRARAAIDGVLAAVARTSPVHPNVDFALGALAHIAQMAPGRAEAVFVIARTAGWVAHALEEYGETPIRFRPRALYTGA